jgi:hypothetical protein
MRGPGIRPRTRVAAPVWNGDIPATFINLARARPDRVIDGRSLLPLFRDPKAEWGRPILFETKTEAGVRTNRYMYAEETNQQFELYDLRKDPYELRNRAADPSFRAIRRDLARDLKRLRACKGTACRLRPRLSLRLVPRGGSTCGRRRASAVLSGADRSHVVGATFTAAGHSHKARRSPFGAVLSGASANSRRSVRVRALVSFRDGRLLGLERRLAGCRG